MKVVRIANTSGFWGDDPTALRRTVEGGHLDYLTSDYLAEVSMSVLKKQQLRDPERGYVFDFIEHITPALAQIEQKGMRVLTNAGGNNPKQCAEHLERIIQQQGLSLTVAYLEGDNIFDNLSDFRSKGTSFTNFETGENFDESQYSFESANAYIGVSGLLKGLETNADIIIAGRVTDSALVLAPFIHEYQWALNDWDKLASGMIAAHCIECGTQVSGGNFSDWKNITNWTPMGFPIIEMTENGDFYVTKHQNTGGLVDERTVKEQLVYEISDPKNYHSPDVVADLRGLIVNNIGENKVFVYGAKGSAPSPYYKVSASYKNGYRATGEIMISGPDALEKAQLFKRIFWERFGEEVYRNNTEFVGYDSCHGQLSPSHSPNEILLKLHAHDFDKGKVTRFTKLIASLILSGPQGVMVTGGRPRVQEVMAYWPSLINKEFVPLRLTYKQKTTEFKAVVHQETYDNQGSESISSFDDFIEDKTGTPVLLSTLCGARSGDKGNSANIGVIAKNEKAYLILKQKLHPVLLKQWFGDRVFGEIIRYELAGMKAFNFMLHDALDGGGTQSLRIDAQGKSFAAALLTQTIYV